MTGQDLKNSILQLAVEGKLVEQREEEGNAKELLNKIESEKKQLIKDKVIKRQKSLSQITEEEIDFDIPESWVWTRLESLTYSIGNKSNQIKQSEILQEGRYPVVSQSMNRIEGYCNEENKLLEIKPLSVIVFGDHSKTLKLIDFDFIIGADGTKIMVPILIYPKYLFYVLNYNVINMRDRGYSRHFQFLKQRLIPLPPLEEQRRIVAKIEELMPYVEKYDQAHSEVVELNKKFPEDMQKSILQYAIQGKLVEQREDEGTAEELYEQIQEEKKKLIKEGKIKKAKALPEIAEDEIPFDIPDNWKWVRIGTIFNLQAGKNITSSNIFENYSNEAPYSCYGGNGTRGFVKTYNREGEYALIGRQGALCGNINIASGQFYATEHAVVVEHFNLTDVSWCGYFLKALNLNKYATATAQPGLAVSNIVKVLIPLPPLGEQKRIIAMIEKIMPYTDQLNRK